MFKKIHKICLQYEIQLIFISEFFSIFFFEISIYIYNF